VKVEPTEREPNYAYTVGLFKRFRHPEVIMFGLAPDVLHQILNGIGDRVRDGQRVSAPSVSSDILEGYECAFREVAPAARGAYMGAATEFYGHDDFPALHCIWPDREGRFPWDRGASVEFRRLQPMLSEGPEPYTHVRPG
jgi:hypothetical protein